MFKISYFILFLFSCITFAQTPIKIANSYNVPVLFLASTSVPMVTVHIAFRAGSAYDGKKFGLSAITSALLTKGYGKLNNQDVANLIADTGAVIDASSSRDMLNVAINSLTEPYAYQKAMGIFTNILSKPNFSSANLIQQKKQQLATLSFERESPEKVAFNNFFATIYPHHPYGHSIYGTEDTIHNIKHSDVINFYKHFFVRENAVMVIVGKIDEVEAKRLAESILAPLKSGKKSPLPPKATHIAKAVYKNISFPANQTTFYIGQLGITHHDKNYFPLLLGNYILGSGDLNSRLNISLREKKGLTYGVTSEFLPMPGIGPFCIHFATKAEEANSALNLTQQITKDFIQNGPTMDELEKAKAYLIGSFPLALASNTSIANMILKIVFYNLPNDFLETYTSKLQVVTVQEIKTALQATLSPANMSTVAVGPAYKTYTQDTSK